MEPILSFPQHDADASATVASAPSSMAALPPRPSGLVEDTTLPYSTRYHSGACRLRIFVPEGHALSTLHPAVVIATEQPEHEGLSVTNGIEVIASVVCRTYGLNPRHTVLIEHYDDRERGTAADLPGRVEGEKFSCVVFDELEVVESEIGGWRLQSPQWRTLAKAAVETLIGTSLP